MVRRVKTKRTNLGAERLYIAKAERFLSASRILSADKNWEATACLAIHAIISSCDALAAKLLGERHAGDDHRGALSLMAELPLANTAELKQMIRRVGEVLAKKTNVEYGEKPMRQAVAENMLREAEKVFFWSKTNLA